jgi:tRNA nucleotidyltransferase (CCA-adding enzyme)
VYNNRMQSLLALGNESPEKMTALLQQVLPAIHLEILNQISEEAANRGLPLYIVGGFVRDLFVGHAGLDFDLVVEGDAISCARTISRKYGGNITIHSHFGTASWQPDVNKLTDFNIRGFADKDIPPLDFVTSRSETYLNPGALPTVKRGSLSDDLRRRDFTINTLALRLDGEHFGQLIDQLGGLEDLKRGIVQVLHRESYVDDPTRILRAVRYEKRYGFRISPEDLDLISKAKSHVGELSGERLRHELDLILAEDKAVEMLTRLEDLDILREIHPLLAWDASTARSLEKLNQPEPDSWKDVPDLSHIPRRVGLRYLAWLGSLAPAGIHELASRLDFAASLREALLASTSLRGDLPKLVNTKASETVSKLDGYPLMVICAASLFADYKTRKILENYLASWRFIRPKTTGYDLIRRGLPPGPIYGYILKSLRQGRLDGDIKNDEEENAHLEELIGKIPPP